MRYIILKTAAKPQRAQRTGSKTRVPNIYRIHLLGDYSVFPSSFKYNDFFSVFSVVNSFFRIIIIALSLCFLLPSAYAAEKDNFQFKKQPELQQIKPKKPVKIKLRRSAKDEYVWELTGDDAEEILKTDKKLRKMLNTQ